MLLTPLKKLRAKHFNISQNELAREVKISVTTIAAIDQGRALPNPDTLFKLADYFQMNPRELWKLLKTPDKLGVAHVGESQKIVKGRSRNYR